VEEEAALEVALVVIVDGSALTLVTALVLDMVTCLIAVDMSWTVVCSTISVVREVILVVFVDPC